MATATLFAATYVVLSSVVSARFPAATLAAAQQMVGLIFATTVLCCVMVFRLEAPDFSTIRAEVLAYAAISGAVQYALAFWLYLVGLRYLAPAVAGLWLTLIPVFGVAGSYLWLGERPTALMLLGGVLIIFAILIGKSEEQ